MHLLIEPLYILICTHGFLFSTGHHCGLEGPVWICSPDEHRKDTYPSDHNGVWCTKSCKVSDWHTEPLCPSDSRGVDKGRLFKILGRWLLRVENGFISVLLTSTKTYSQSSVETGRKEYTPLVEFAELGKGGGDGNFEKEKTWTLTYWEQNKYPLRYYSLQESCSISLHVQQHLFLNQHSEVSSIQQTFSYFYPYCTHDKTEAKRY